MTVIDNVKTAMNMHMHYSLLSAVLRSKHYWREEAEMEEKALQSSGQLPD